MKNMKSFLFGLAFVAVAGPFAYAVDEPASVVNFAQSELGQVKMATTAAPAGVYPVGLSVVREARAVSVGQDGVTNVRFAVKLASYSEAATSTNTNTMDTIAASTGGMGNPIWRPNANVLAIGFSSAPVHLKLLTIGDVVGAMNVQVFDTRGSTAIGKIYDGTFTSSAPAPIQFDYFASSGITVRKTAIIGGAAAKANSTFWFDVPIQQ